MFANPWTRAGIIGALSIAGLAVLAVLVVGTGDPGRRGAAEIGTVSDVRPEVACDGTDCTLRIAASVGGGTVLSDPLPFPPTSAEIEAIPADASFGLGPVEGRALSAWAVGVEEKSVGVAVEPIALGGTRGLIVHQSAGFEHVKRSHLVLAIMEDRIGTLLEIVEGAGPELVALWPEGDGITVSRRFGDGPEEVERYRWDESGATPSLVPVD